MLRRALVILALGSALGILFATVLGPRPVNGEEAPPELKKAPARPTRTAKDISRPIIEATRRVRPAVVQIRNFRRVWGGGLKEWSTGSGFVISKEGHVLTNRHVVEGDGVLVIEAEDGRTFEQVKVLGADRRSDVAILQIEDLEDADLPVAVLGDSDALEVGEIVVAIGSPFQLDSSVSMGVVSATGRTGLLGGGAAEEFIQTDAALNRGNSGGPLINLDGQVVGINTAIRQERGGGNIGIGFAIPINLARTVALSLIEEGVARRGRIGIYFHPVNDRLNRFQLRTLGIDAVGGIRVASVEPESPAETSGIRPGDIVLEADGRAITDVSLLQARLAQAGPGGRVTLKLQAKGEDARMLEIELEEEKLADYGIEVETLTPQRAQSLGLPPGTRGVVVTRIVENSVAAHAEERNRLLPGDVIQAIRSRWKYYQIQDEQDFLEAMVDFTVRPPDVILFFIRTKQGQYRVDLRPPTGRS